MKYSIQLKVYEGPIELLFDLISKQKIDIKDISINEITNQYMNYLNLLGKMDLEITSEFISMASKLLEIKSRYLLFRQRNLDEELDPRLELIEKLEEYKKYKLASENLKQKIENEEIMFFRTKEEVISEEKLDFSKINLDEIKKILPFVFKVKKEEVKIEDKNLEKIVKRNVVSVEEKILYIKNILQKKQKVKFFEITTKNSKDEKIATFLSILELIKTNEIKIVQESFLGEIVICKNFGEKIWKKA